MTRTIKKAQKKHKTQRALVKTVRKIEGKKRENKSDWKKVVGQSLGAAGDVVATAFPVAAPFVAAGKAFGKLFGFGDYRGRAAAVNAGASPSVFAGSQAPIVTHREYLFDLVTPGPNFNIQSYPINPGNSSLFPWLCQLAVNFEEYEFMGCMFEFKTNSATSIGSTNTALGTVIMSTEYDVSKPAFSSKTQMENYEFTTSCVPCQSMYHPVECSEKKNPINRLFVNNGSMVGTYDPHLYNLGNFQVATVGQQAASNIGEVWVTYKVKLLKPRLTQTAPSFSFARFSGTNLGGIQYTYTSANFIKRAGSMTGLTLGTYTSGGNSYPAMYFANPGRYHVSHSLSITNSPTATGLSSLITIGGASLPSCMVNNTATVAVINNTSYGYSVDFEIIINQPGDGYCLLHTWTGGTSSQCDLFITNMPNVSPYAALPDYLVEGIRNLMAGEAPVPSIMPLSRMTTPYEEVVHVPSSAYHQR